MPIGSTLDVVIQQDDLVVLGPPSAIDVAVDIGPRGEAGTQLYTGAFNPNDLTFQQFQDIYGDIPRLRDLFLRTDEGPEYGSFYQFTNVPGNDQWEIVVDFIGAIELFFDLNTDFVLQPKSGGTGVNNGTNTIAIGGNFQTLGNFPLDLSLSGSTALNLPISGDVAVKQDKLNVFAATTSAELASVITDETGAGQLVFNTSPNISTSIETNSTSFNLLNTNATEINLGGNATSLFIGATSGITTIRNDLLISASHLTTLDGIEFSDTPGIIDGERKLLWNDDDGTLDLGLKGGNVTLQVGQEFVARVFNDSGATLNDGDIVIINGAQGQRVSVDLADASSGSYSAAHAFGVVTETILAGEEGYVTTQGTVRGLNTFIDGSSEGKEIFLSPTTPGAWTTTRPPAPNHAVRIGWIQREHAAAGSIYVNIQVGEHLEFLHDVLIPNPSNNDLLWYQSASGIWVNENISTIINSTPITFTSEVLGISPTSSAAFATKLYVDDLISVANLPPQAGQEGKYLSTTGSAAFWTDVVSPEEVIGITFFTMGG
jgi:hypothetical protein